MHVGDFFNCAADGVAQLDDILYVNCGNDFAISKIVTYNPVSLFPQNQIPLVGATSNLNDIAAGIDCKCLYVVDQRGNTLWRVNVTSNGYVVDQFVNVTSPTTLSVSVDGRVFVSSSMYNTLWIFSPQGTLLRTINMIPFKFLQHVVERSTYSMIVSQAETYSIVSEVEESGLMKTLHTYGTTVSGKEPGELNYPQHLALDRSGDGWLFVADSSNRRVVMLDAQFKLITTWEMPIDNPHKPYRVSYDSASRFLYVNDRNFVLQFHVLVN